MRPVISILTVGLLAAGPASSIYVTPGSQCERLCGNVPDDVDWKDLVCEEKDYASTAEGIVFQQCTSCQLDSTFSAGRQSDLKWLLLNLRYAVGHCFYGYPDNDEVGSHPCLTSTACEPLENAITYNDLADNGTALDYCGVWIHDQMDKCSACLRADEETNYIPNFMTILHAACEQRPEPGDLVHVEGNPFSTVPVNLTDPTPIASDLPNYYPGPLSLDARVGIAFGGLVIILIVAGFFIICNGRRKRRSFLKNLDARLKQGRGGWPTPINTGGSGAGGAGGYFDHPPSQKPPRNQDDTPLSQKPLRDWDASPQSAFTEKFQGRYFSPYSTHFSSPDTAVEGRNMPWPVEKGRSPVQTVQEIGVALGGSDPSLVDTKGKDGYEAYELKEVDSHQQMQGTYDIGQPGRTVFAPYNPADYQDVDEDDIRRGRGW